jgi:hypothetical protein
VNIGMESTTNMRRFISYNSFYLEIGAKDSVKYATNKKEIEDRFNYFSSNELK